MAGSLPVAGLYLVAERVFVLFTELFGCDCTATALTPDDWDRLADADAARAAGIGWFTGDGGSFLPAAFAASVFATMGLVLSVAFFCVGAFLAAAGFFAATAAFAAGFFTAADFFVVATFVTLFFAAAAFLAGADLVMAFLPGGFFGTTLFATAFCAAGFFAGAGFATTFFLAAGLAAGFALTALPAAFDFDFATVLLADLAVAGVAFLALLALADFPLGLPIRY